MEYNMGANLVGAGIFLCSTILICIALLAVAGTLIAINNLLHRYWNELDWKMFKSPQVIYIQQEPEIEKTKTSK